MVKIGFLEKIYADFIYFHDFSTDFENHDQKQIVSKIADFFKKFREFFDTRANFENNLTFAQKLARFARKLHEISQKSKLHKTVCRQ